MGREECDVEGLKWWEGYGVGGVVWGSMDGIGVGNPDVSGELSCLLLCTC